jgi:hypothetical protein
MDFQIEFPRWFLIISNHLPEKSHVIEQFSKTTHVSDCHGFEGDLCRMCSELYGLTTKDHMSPEYGGVLFFRNAGNHLSDYTLSQPRRSLFMKHRCEYNKITPK